MGKEPPRQVTVRILWVEVQVSGLHLCVNLRRGTSVAPSVFLWNKWGDFDCTGNLIRFKAN